MRKFNPSRLYKLMRFIVIIVSAFCLFIGTIGFMNLEKTDLFYLNESSKCFKQNPNVIEICYKYMDFMYDNKKTIWQLLTIGILLPTVFFGGGALIRYLFPLREDFIKVEKKRNKK
ncbi:hypothetical protein HZA75_03220 [Candidatus Roizmanbacteria bacterium]|nr:hypothetical protein [Candidatus Roizmanbacteria bacterium]